MKIKISIILLIIFLLSTQSVSANMPSLAKLNNSLNKAQGYYEGLYKDLGDKGAVVNEYYSSSKSYYTIRHGVIGGIYYYNYTGDKTKAAQLTKFASSYGFNPDNDLHSYIWKQTDNHSPDEIYSQIAYHDCAVILPKVGNEIPYRSKVCKLGSLGISIYTKISKLDTLLPTIGQLQTLESKGQIDKLTITDLENKYNKLGFGMPICMGNSCSGVASAIRTAEFGDLELRLHNMNYADKAANDLLKAQDKQGAIYYSYDKDGKLKNKKPSLYSLIELFLSDPSIFNGYIPSNAESMNDIIAFLLQYRCEKYHIACKSQ